MADRVGDRDFGRMADDKCGQAGAHHIADGVAGAPRRHDLAAFTQGEPVGHAFDHRRPAGGLSIAVQRPKESHEKNRGRKTKGHIQQHGGGQSQRKNFPCRPFVAQGTVDELAGGIADMITGQHHAEQRRAPAEFLHQFRLRDGQSFTAQIKARIGEPGPPKSADAPFAETAIHLRIRVLTGNRRVRHICSLRMGSVNLNRVRSAR
ncbi:MAG: hypothetical protein BWY83_02552 [bacterium ADurb.Bin478]|nr:MAG: hypothetical protein BWY83_02552 [bacterium ADurb.Bin478]